MPTILNLPKITAVEMNFRRDRANCAETVHEFLFDVELRFGKSHRAALEAVWGFGDDAPKSVSETALALGISTQAIEQMVAESMAYAREWFGAQVPRELKAAA